MSDGLLANSGDVNARISDYLSAGHKTIDGWFFGLDMGAFIELYALQKKIGVSGNICEVGVWKGKSLVLMSLLREREERLICFDLFDADNEEITKDNLKKHGYEADIDFHKGLTSDISRPQLDDIFETPMRFLHIDAGHEYHEVLDQLHLFTPYLGDYGVVAMDDYQDREFPGIEAAVLDFAQKVRPRQFVPFLATGNKMYLCQKHVASVYQSLILRVDLAKDACRLTRVRDFNILVLRSKLPVSSEVIEQQIKKTAYPHHDDDEKSLREKALLYSQLSFGSGSNQVEDINNA